MKLSSIFISAVLVITFMPLACASAATPAEQEFVPVQKGFQSMGEKVLPYAPDRVMVKFTRSAYKNSSLNIRLQRGTEVPNGLTGISSVDALSRDVGAEKISRPYIEPKNKVEAIRLGVDRWFKIDLPEGTDIEKVVEQYAGDPNVEYARPDYRAFPMAVPGDPLYPDHWGHNNTAQLPSYDWNTHTHTGPQVGTVGFDANAEAAWDGAQGYGSSDIVIAILDSGVDIDHPDLNLVSGYDFGSDDSNPDDDSSSPGHGTCCAGVAASVADNGLGATGAAPGCSIMPCKVADNAGSMYFSYIENAIYWAADNGADVISMSLGAAVTSDPATDAAIEYAYNAGVVILAATGNENASTISYPAINPYVIGVGAASPCGDRKRSSSNTGELNPGVDPDPNGYTCDGERWWGSNYGSTTQDAAGAVDVIAPTIVPTTDIGGSGGYQSGDYEPFFNGTSCATPYAAGVCGLIKSANPTWSASQIREQLVTTAIDIQNVESGSGWDRYSGYGMVDAEAAVGGAVTDPPVAGFTGSPTSGDYPLTVNFTDESTNSPTSWSWDFGDGATSTSQNPSHEYTAAGTYTVELTVTNSAGSDTETKLDYITVTEPTNPPVAAFSGSPTSGEAPLTVNFTDESTSGPTSWSWTFGDGGTSTAQNPSYEYAAAGTYTVELTVTNAYGSDTETKTDYITVTEPGQTTRVYANADIPVTGNVTGSYSNTTASDDSDETITEVAYTGHPRKTYSYLEHKWTFAVPSNSGDVTFYLEAARDNNSDGDDFTFAYSMDDVTYNNMVTVASATDQTYSASLPAGTSGTVYVRVVDTQRNWDGTSNDPVHIDYMYIEVGSASVSPPVAGFSGSPTSGDAPLTVNFTDESTNNPTSWSWDFGDGATSTSQNPSHEYTVAGTYTVSLTVTNSAGSDTESKTDYITVSEATNPPVAAFSGSPTSGEVPLTVNFTDESTNSPTSWSWTFGDGGTSTAQNPSYEYAAAGTYTVELTVTNAYGSDTETKTDYITVTEQGTGPVMHVSDITVGRRARGVNLNGTADVLVVDSGGSPVANATVYGFFNAPNTSTMTSVTGTDGVAYFETARTKDAVADFCFEVTDVTLSGGTYDSAANAVTKSCESGDVFSSGSLALMQSNRTPEEYGLMQNHPNPFNPVTTIRFNLPEDTQVKLEVYDVQGRLVETLANGTFSSGFHAAEWNATGVSSGVYFYRLVTPSFTEMKKMILLR